MKGADNTKLMKAGLRGDNGAAACVSGGTLAAMGGDGAAVAYHGVSIAELLVRDRWLGAQFAVSVLTVVGAAITAYSTYIKRSGELAGSFAHETALVVIVISASISILKFLKEYREL